MGFWSGLWNLIKLLLALVGLYKPAESAADAARRAEAEKKRQEREKALKDLENAQTEDDFDRAQDSVVRNRP